ncbi:MAG: hypothetical protein EOP11_20110 [Proteobacteria bacterium]|jgi:hypothetical protein|nr:MAG: hypothetical protein EOP11_20110 [Pseudomonadota bacterium]
MGLFEAHEEKKLDTRLIDRARQLGRLKITETTARHAGLADDAEHGVYTNLDELNARDNPVHVARNLPTLDVPAPRNIEDMEFDSDESNRGFEQ